MLAVTRAWLAVSLTYLVFVLVTLINAKYPDGTFLEKVAYEIPIRLAFIVTVTVCRRQQITATKKHREQWM